MSTTQPEALWLADELEAEFAQGRTSNHTGSKAATELRRQHAECEALRAAAQAVIDRWDTPLWKDVEPTAAVIGRLRAAVASEQARAGGEP